MGRWTIVQTSAICAALAWGAILLTGAPEPSSDLRAGVGLYSVKQLPAAIAMLEPLAPRLPLLQDYVAWFLGSAYSESRNFAKAAKALEPVWNQKPTSPLAGRAVLLGSAAMLETAEAQQAVALLRKYYAVLTQPQGDMALGQALEKWGDAAAAAATFQKVYYTYPASTEAYAAEIELGKLKIQLGDQFPAVSGRMMLDRALKLLAAGQATRARNELLLLEPQLTGADRDLARVRIGVALYNIGSPVGKQHLATLDLTSPEADGERLYYLLQYARRRGAKDEVAQMLDRFATERPASPWRLRALLAIAEPLFAQNQQDAYEPLYRACAESFPKDPQAALCHWRAAWAHYLQRRPDALEMMRAHLKQYPGSDEAASAFYFTGRLAEAAGDAAAARTYFEEGGREFPNLYFGVLARERLDGVRGAPLSPGVAQFLKSIAFPQRVRSRDFQPNAATRLRVERARLLQAAGLNTWAEGELRYAGENEDQPHIIGTELANMFAATRPDQAVRYTKRYIPGLPYVPVEAAPPEVWKLAFPLPFRADMERFSRQYGVDPYLAAALIRQESEFDSGAVSRSSARGLMQIMPATGLDLSQRLRIPGYSTPRLFEPALNLRMGTYYLGMLMSQTMQTEEYALAAYNAGLGRVHTWQTWAEFREPAEFVQTIPLPETRNYVQIVLRNADVYRRVWGGGSQVASARR